MFDKKSLDSMKIILKAGQKKSICSCGSSKTLPYCDNSHREINEEKGTSYKSIKVSNPSDKDMVLKFYSNNWPKDRLNKNPH